MILDSIKFSFEVHGHEFKIKSGIKVVIFSSNIQLDRDSHRGDGERGLTRVEFSLKPSSGKGQGNSRYI